MDSIDLDEKDRKIIALYEVNPDVSQAEIAEQVGLSQPTVGARISKLKQAGVISTLPGMSLTKVGLKLAKVDVTARSSVDLLGRFKACPCFLNGFVLSGKENLSLLFTAEDLSTIDSIVDKHIRNSPDVTGVDMGIVITTAGDLVMPVRLNVKKGEKTPCGLDCRECAYYASGRCLGCAASTAYKGTFW